MNRKTKARENARLQSFSGVDHTGRRSRSLLASSLGLFVSIPITTWTTTVGGHNKCCGRQSRNHPGKIDFYRENRPRHPGLVPERWMINLTLSKCYLVPIRTLLIESVKIAKEYLEFFETSLFKISSHIARVEKKKEKKGAKLEPFGDGLITISTSSRRASTRGVWSWSLVF